ncbi:hypothetical protein BaRGS_00006251 [Batillaria attramentaria]|uniref:Uncharacterized protein n=1 Tax=Batillaria attramentaria TaxID=370345 RepID=A0ABD0LS41_9CAEN|nr:hypothetical protein BaRGS_022246 [Batillaria attramentaria]
MRFPCRWRTLGAFLLSIVVVLNFLIFLTLPGERQNELFWDDETVGNLPHHYDSRGISHLQAPRRRLNKSNFTSDSLGADVGGGGAWEEVVVGDHPPLQPNPDMFAKARVNPGNSRKGINFQDKAPASADDIDRQNGGKDRAGVLSRTNFTDARVDEFMVMLERKGLLDIVPGTALEDEDYWEFLRRQRKNRRKGIQLPAYKNYRG